MAKVSVQKKTKTKQPVPAVETTKTIKKTKAKTVVKNVPQKPAQSKVKKGAQAKVAAAQKTLGLSQVSTASKISSSKSGAATAGKPKRKVSVDEDAPAVQPKRALTAYVCYTKAKLSAYKSQHPEFGIADCMKALAADWSKMTD